MPLTPKQQRFVGEYLKDLNGKQAAIRCGYAPKNAEVTASKLLRISNVAAAVAEGQAQQFERLGITADDLMRANRNIIEADLADTQDEDGHTLPLRKIPKHLRLALKGMKVRTVNLTAGDGVQDEVVELLLNDRSAAIALDYKRLNLLIERAEVTGTLIIKNELPDE